MMRSFLIVCLLKVSLVSGDVQPEAIETAAHPDKFEHNAHMIWNGDHYEPATTYNAGTFNGATQIALATGTACMGLSTVAFQMMAKESTKRFNYVAMAVTGIATFAYLAMFSGAGLMYNEGRWVYWMRYVDWFFTTPFFLLDLALLAGADQWDTFYVMLMNAICIVCGAIGGLDLGGSCVPMFILGMITFVLFLQKLFGSMMARATQLGPDVAGKYKSVVTLTMGIWCAYPIMYFLCEMTGMIDQANEVILYAILDVTAKCVCGFMLLANHDILEMSANACKTE